MARGKKMRMICSVEADIFRKVSAGIKARFVGETAFDLAMRNKQHETGNLLLAVMQEDKRVPPASPAVDSRAAEAEAERFKLEKRESEAADEGITLKGDIEAAEAPAPASPLDSIII